MRNPAFVDARNFRRKLGVLNNLLLVRKAIEGVSLGPVKEESDMSDLLGVILLDDPIFKEPIKKRASILRVLMKLRPLMSYVLTEKGILPERRLQQVTKSD